MDDPYAGSMPACAIRPQEEDASVNRRHICRVAALSVTALSSAAWFGGFHHGGHSQPHPHGVALGDMPRPTASARAARALPTIGEMDRSRGMDHTDRASGKDRMGSHEEGSDQDRNKTGDAEDEEEGEED